MENTSASLTYNWSILRLFILQVWGINIIPYTLSSLCHLAIATHYPDYLTYETEEYK